MLLNKLVERKWRGQEDQSLDEVKIWLTGINKRGLRESEVGQRTEY